MRASEKQRIRRVIKATDRAEDKLYLAKKLIDDAISLIEVAFVLHDKKLYDEVKTTKEKRRDKKLKRIEEELDDGDEMD